MKQLFMKKNALKPATVRVEEVPMPGCGPSSVLLANRFSLISAGTETAAVRRNKREMVTKVLRDPELRQSVVEMVVQDGIKKTADRVQYEMTKWTPLGYSGAGVAVEVGRNVDGIGAGDVVAYGGRGHAQYIQAQKHLCLRVPEGVTAREAAFVAVGSIALQAVRRANVQVGDVAAVLGLGLVGQLVSQLLQAAGARVIGSDVIRSRLELAGSTGLERGFTPGDKLPEEILRHTDGAGVDHVLICASTSSRQVIEQAVAMARDRGRITVVGMVNLDVPCEDFYNKELDLVISRSYGPGRYDPQYEEHGVDYPLGYVRWTENRNMQEFLRLVGAKKVDVDKLISHEFDLAEAERAFAELMEHPEDSLAILLRYEEQEELPLRTIAACRSASAVSRNGSTAGMAVVGCGGFARQFHLPNLKTSRDVRFQVLVDADAQNAKEMALRYGAADCTTDLRDALRHPDVEAVMILTHDNTHAPLAIAALEAGKHVFCEKPLATTYEQCRQIADLLRDGGPLCTVGFNRRFAPLVRPIKEILSGCKGPMTIHYRVNAGPLPKDHWTFDPAHAAGRVVGEVCHFVDLMTWLIGFEPIGVFAQAAGECPSLAEMEDVSATFQFADGSVGTVLYTGAGASSLGKERMEVFTDGTAVVMDDFRRLSVRGCRRQDVRKRRADKGHDAEFQHFAGALVGRHPLEVTHHDGIRGTVCCLKIFDSVKTGGPVDIDPDAWK